MKPAIHDIAAGFLAGGQARRMGGGDKARLLLCGRSILDWQLDATQAHRVRLISANGDPARYADTGLPVVADNLAKAEFAGPLAGILAMLDWLAETGQASWLISLATDAPFVPPDLAEQLAAGLQADRAELAQARSGGRRHPVFALWPVALAAELRAALEQDGLRKIDDFTARYRLAIIDFVGQPDPFFNINRPQDLAAAEKMAEKMPEKIPEEMAE